MGVYGDLTKIYPEQDSICLRGTVRARKWMWDSVCKVDRPEESRLGGGLGVYSFAGLRAWDLGFGVWGFEFKAYITVLGFAGAEPLA